MLSPASKDPEPASPQDDDSRRQVARGAQPLILVVDDSPTIRQLLAVTLERQQYRVQVAADGMEALAMMQKVVPDLILLDVSMPYLDGFKICRVVKENGMTKAVPVVFLLGRGHLSDRVRGWIAGAAGFLTKPIDPTALIRIVAKNCS